MEQSERPARRSYNYSAAEEYEAEVCQLGNNIAVRLLGVDPRGVRGVSSSGWRVDKLANRTSCTSVERIARFDGDEGPSWQQSRSRSRNS